MATTGADVRWLMVNSNILLYTLCAHLSEHALAVEALRSARAHEWDLCITPQIYPECLVVMTGAMQTRQKRSVTDCQQALEGLVNGFAVFHDEAVAQRNLISLVTSRDIRGKRIHDASIVARMQSAKVTTLLTHKVVDFAPFADLIRVIPLDGAVEALA